VTDLACNATFRDENEPALRRRGAARRKEFQRDGLAQFEIVGAIDFTHAAFAN